MAPPSKPLRRSKSEYVIQTVTNALRLLEAFRDAEELGVTELARRLDLHKNNVFRLLATLEQRDYVQQTPGSDRYRLSVRCQDLGHSFARGSSLWRHGRQMLESLVSVTGESAHLAALLDLEVAHLDGEACDQPILSNLRKGQRLPLHCTALGKVLLASAGEEVWQEYDKRFASDGELPRFSAATLVDRDKFFDHLKGVAGAGFALDLEECHPGMVCAAAPVLDASGRTIAALSISAPSSRVDEDALRDELAPAVVRAAEQLSGRLGYLG